ncbi:hypothetical protein [Marinicella rhabdoformis]|uniref:hypothetical protein n=1 Tax=Marinicella rhabdoformis TaxID=2580566 RepID=UPI0012AEDDA5|nr:hypothetical protein [Marinicella rhabdoformis]
MNKLFICFLFLYLASFADAITCSPGELKSSESNHFEIEGPVFKFHQFDDKQSKEYFAELNFLEGSYSLRSSSNERLETTLFEKFDIEVSEKELKFWEGQKGYYSSMDSTWVPPVATRGNCGQHFAALGMAYASWLSFVSKPPAPTTQCDNGCLLVMADSLWGAVSNAARDVALCLFYEELK